MKRVFIIALATALPFICLSQGRYVAFATGYMPLKQNTGFIAAEVTVGSCLCPAPWFAEFKMNISLTSHTDAPKYFQLRTGPVIKLDRMLKLYPFAGYSITTAPKCDSRPIGHGVTAGAYLIQKTEGDFSVKYEISINNSFHIVPTVGLYYSF